MLLFGQRIQKCSFVVVECRDSENELITDIASTLNKLWIAHEQVRAHAFFFCVYKVEKNIMNKKAFA